VLLVEDEPFVREATTRILQSAGFEVLPAADALEAVQLYEQQSCRIDVLMSDLVLPGRSGRQLGHELRRISPALPILLTSGYLDPGIEVENLDPRTYYLPKPYTRLDLIEKMRQIGIEEPQGRAASQAG